MTPQKNQDLFSACDLQGRLFLHDQLQSAFARKNLRQADADYCLPPGLTIKEESSRAFRIAKASWENYQKALLRTDSSSDGAARKAAIRTYAQYFFQSALGYASFAFAEARTQADGRGFAVQAFADGLPVVIVPGDTELDTAIPALAVENGSGTRKSAFQNIQEFLNASPDHAWGFAFNGRAVRLVRDAMSLTRPSYLEFNLDEIFNGESYFEFIQLWAVLHASRAKRIDGASAWDLWIKAGEETGQPIREKIGYHVRRALEILGSGFISDFSNKELREALRTRKLTEAEYVHELLRLMYRFLFIFCLEERDLLNTDGENDREGAQRYREGYALRRFRDMSIKRRFFNRHCDAWESVKVVFRALGRGEPFLALPALGGLFEEDACPYLDRATLANKDFFEAMRNLRWAMIDGVTAPIDYKNMGTEELGSIYEGLLELVPYVKLDEGILGFVGQAKTASERKSTGSYYTPDALVQSLIKTALDPVISSAVQRHPSEPVKALLSLKVIDPTCGSGHFLLAAARRIAEKVAELRSPDGAVTPASYREALRDVIQHDIYGVDLNPLAIELARMALWLEGYCRGKPLSFLDHHLKVGNTVIGVGKLKQLAYGISPDAFKAQMGDDKAVCKRLARKNANGLEYLKSRQKDNGVQPEIEGFGGGGDLAEFVELRSKVEDRTSDNLNEVKKTKAVYDEISAEMAKNRLMKACDLFMAAFLSPKTLELEKIIPTTEHLGRCILNLEQPEDAEVQAYASQFCRAHHVFHWELEFADVFADDGFDCILGNPPWEKAKVEDVKWFSVRSPDIADASTGAIRKKMIAALEKGTYHSDFCDIPHSEALAASEKALYADYCTAQQQAGAGALYGHTKAKEGGRFPLTGTGDTNLYAYVAETMLAIRKPSGSAGIVAPPGLVTDDSCKAFAKKVLDGGISSLYQFDNTEKIFPIHSSYVFALFTFRKSNEMESVFYASNVAHLEDERRKVTFEKGDFEKFNPNTGTCLFVRTRRDLELCRKIYDAAPVLINESVAGGGGNPWKIRTLSMFHMTNDSGLFQESNQDRRLVPLYEGKLIHQFDNRFATYVITEGKNGKKKAETVEVTLGQKQAPYYTITPKFWVDPKEVQNRFTNKDGTRWWTKSWMLAFRDIASTTNQRTVICSVLPSTVAAGNKAPLILPDLNDKITSCLLGNLNSLLLDYVDRIKQPSTTLNLFILKQLPVLSPNHYHQEDIDYISCRVAKLTRTNKAISDVWLTEYPEYVYQTPKERLKIRAELDAYYAHLYGLSRKDLEYVLDPSEVCGDDWPSVTFPGLKRDEIKAYGEFLTRRLVLEAYDELARTRFAERNPQ